MAPKALQLVQSSDAAYLEDLKRKFALSQDLCEPARREWQIDQDYYDGKQWTPEEIAILQKRKQPALVFNHIKPAVNGIIGLVDRGKTDPKAYGRTPNDNDAADVATDCLRYVADVNRFQNLRSQALKDMLIPGICCAVVEIDERKEVKIVKGRPEAFFYDPYSREPDFSDARFLGLANWMDEEDALALVDDADPKKEEKRRAVTQSIDVSGLAINQTSEDRPRDGWSWGDAVNRRVMVVQMWHRKGPIWHMCKFVSGGILESGESPYKDADGKPTCQLIAQSAYVDRDNKRMGVVRDMRGPQDSINKGRSKAIHLLNVRQVRVDPGVQDVDEIRAESAKPDAVYQYRKDQFEILPTHTQFMPAHLELLQDAKAEMTRQSPSPGIVGRQAQGQSGRAILAEQQAGMTEQAPLLGSFDDWTMRVYRAVWACVKQFWDGPKYIRVTDDEDAPKFVMMNEPAVMIGPDGQPVAGPDGQPIVDPNKPPLNSPAQMDVDIIIESTPDVANLQEEQFAKLVELATVGAQTGTGSIPFEAVIEASSLPRKRQVLEKMKKAAEEAKNQPQQPGPAEQEQAKATVQLQAKQQQNEMDGQAHAAQLARDDEADERRHQRAMALEDKKFANQQRTLDMTAQHEQASRDAEFDHGQRQSEMQFDFKQREGALKSQQAASKPSAGGEQGQEDDDDMKFELPRDLAEALVQHVAGQRTQVAERQTAAASAQEQVPAALLRAAEALEKSAETSLQVAQETLRIMKAPKRLNVDKKTGQKTVEVMA